jgi:fructose 1,6-bisphosphatase
MEIFGKIRGKEMAVQIGAPLLAQIPIDPDLVKLCDKGEIEKYNSPAYKMFADNLAKVITEEIPAEAD